MAEMTDKQKELQDKTCCMECEEIVIVDSVDGDILYGQCRGKGKKMSEDDLLCVFCEGWHDGYGDVYDDSLFVDIETVEVEE